MSFWPLQTITDLQKSLISSYKYKSNFYKLIRSLFNYIISISI